MDHAPIVTTAAGTGDPSVDETTLPSTFTGGAVVGVGDGIGVAVGAFVAEGSAAPVVDSSVTAPATEASLEVPVPPDPSSAGGGPDAGPSSAPQPASSTANTTVQARRTTTLEGRRSEPFTIGGAGYSVAVSTTEDNGGKTWNGEGFSQAASERWPWARRFRG